MIQDTVSTVVNTGFAHLVFDASVPTQVVLAICAAFSLASWFVIAAKWWEFRHLRADRRDFQRAMTGTEGIDEKHKAVRGLAGSPFADVIVATAEFITDLRGAMQRAGVARSGLSLTQLEALMLTVESRISRAIERTRRMIPLLAIVGSTAPLLGLLGTVVGIINAFLGIASAGTGNIRAVGPGIADALIATAAGLGAAIPAVIAYNVFTGRSERLESELEQLAQDTVGELGREGKL
ncbi:MAG: MotA/TolQ/ExbB proton channel family protein [Gemmatimonadales bacterium]